MVKNKKTNKKTNPITITEIETSLKEIEKKVNQANQKLDHLIETYRKDRYSIYGLYNPFSGEYINE